MNPDADPIEVGSSSPSSGESASGVSPWPWRLAGLAVLAASAAWVFWRYLITYPGEVWQLDLAVYRDGAYNLITGYPIYDWLTGAPQFLPFTYPPFSALMMVPAALIPFTMAGWVWSLLQVGLVWVCAGIAFAPLLARFGHRAALAQGVVAAVLFQLFPVSDGIRFGQMNAVIVTLCLLDARPDRIPARWLPRGVLTGLAAAIKLTPAAFWLHFAVSKRWRELSASVGAAAAATALAFAAEPSSSAVFWTDAVSDPARLGPNNDVSNQSLRGVLLRLGPEQPNVQSLVWLVLVALVLWWGLRTSSRFEAAGNRVAVVATIGMVIVLISPVSWIHHWHWSVAVLGALLGDGRDRQRQIAVGVLTVFLFFAAPWWGGPWPGLLRPLGLVVQNSYAVEALVALALLARLSRAPRQPRQRSGSAVGAEK